MWLAAIRIGCDKSLQLQRDLRLRPIAAAPEWLNLFLAKLAEQRQAVLSLLNEDFAEPPEALRMELCEYDARSGKRKMSLDVFLRSSWAAIALTPRRRKTSGPLGSAGAVASS